MTSDLQIVILVGGRGTRLKSLTENLPKPMVSIHGIPFLEILLKLLQRKEF
ncbi:MAG: dehydrogenase, partial [Patescibacteria group bacterium]|nr:dehydrogenase [Patescibacteria group bacterium]